MRDSTFALLAAISAIGLGSSASAQDYPQRPITVVVGNGPGGGSDLMARAIADAISSTSDLTFQIENRPGAGGLVAATDVLGRPADGYTILQRSDGLASMIGTGAIDASFGTDIAPICLTQSTFSQLYVRAGDTDLDSIGKVEQAGAEDRLTMANSTIPGGMEYVLGNSLAKAIGGRIEQINFDNPSERYAALLGGQVDLLLEQPGDVAPYVEAGQFAPILTLLDTRASSFPDVPSLSDAGYDDVPALERVRGLFARGEVPDDRLDVLRAACEAGYATEAYQEFNAQSFMDPERSLRVGDGALAFLQELVGAYAEAEQEALSQ